MYLRFSPRNFKSGGIRAASSSISLIQKRHAHFQIRRHRRLVRGHQVETRQKRFQIDVEQPVERRRIFRSRKVLPVHRVGIHALASHSRRSSVYKRAFASSVK